MNRARTLLIAKHLFYIFTIFFAYILQTTPGLFALGGLKPMLLIPVATTIAMLEGEFAGGIYGAMAGLLCDLGAYTLFGFNGFLLCLSGIVVGLLTIYLVRGN